MPVPFSGATLACGVFVLLIGSANATVELTDDTFEDAVLKSGKSAFVKFFAPWCGHCKKMKPTWDELAEEYESSDSILIADVDCIGAGKDTCSKFGVKGFPTIKSFNPPDDEGELYSGGRELKELKAFVKKNLGPQCSADYKELCSEDDLVVLEKNIAMGPEKRAEKIAKIKKELDDADEADKKLLADLQAQYRKANQDLVDLREKMKPTMRMLRAATSLKDAAAGGEEGKEGEEEPQKEEL